MNEAITTINELVKQHLDAKNVRSCIFGLSEATNYDSGERVVPAIVNGSGELFTDLFDDRFQVGLYHKLNSKEYITDTDNGYGNSSAESEVDNMSLICYGMRDRIDGYELETAIVDMIRSVSITHRSKRTSCEVTGSLFNRQQVFSAEYSGVQMFLQPNVFLFRITYKILTAQRKCN